MRKLFLLGIVMFAVLSACSPKKEVPVTVKPTLDSLLKNYHEAYLRLFPLSATSAGDNRYNDQLPNTLTADYRRQVKDFYEGYRKQLTSFDRTALSANDKMSYDLLLYECDINLEGQKFKDYLMPISQTHFPTEPCST